ncbi:MAG: Crp/Fnr family transcriptional regulator [Caldilineaceae bacterium]|nr:Crp/Fnr family transcriptional regulator [Caldilineaceae bacterium]HRJ40792.1 Crp/Fnr family transcriptional regulator [Caldilineaceae bacterium]
MQDAELTRRVTLLKEIPLFSSLAGGQLERLVNDFRLREFDKDDIIFRQGDESREIYIVLRGKVRIYKISPSGNETSIDIFSVHDVIGELAAIDSSPRSATGKAIGKVSLLTMSHERFLYHLENVPGLALGLAQLLAHKLRWTASFAESIAQFDAAGRLLHILLYYVERYGKELEAGHRYSVDLALNQTDLASMVGARREWVNRLLSDWRRRGLLEFERGVITILDMERVVAERDSRIEILSTDSDW